MSKKVQVPTGKIGETTQWLGVVALPTSSIGTGYYGNFYDTTTQTIASTTTAYTVAIGNTTASSGVSIVAGTKITFANAGTYNLQFSVQLTSSDASIHDVNLWIRKNGSDVAYSNGLVSVPNKHGAVNGNLIAAWNIMLALSAGDYLELMWSATSTAVSISTIAAGSSPTTPVSPGVIVTVDQLVAGGGGGGGGGVTAFTGLSDVPSTYAGSALKTVRVNAAATGLEFASTSGGGNATTAVLDFGTGAGEYSASTVVTGQTWVTGTSSIIATFIDYASNNSAEDASVDGVSVTIGDIIAGTGFTVYAASPYGSVGQFKVACLGV